ncbi:MAG: FAD-dependent oxidoreductase [Chloroflexota bacterium]
MTNSAQLIIIGSGIVGCSAAYHLAKLGWTDILVLDKGDSFENDGSTSHAPGGVVALSHSKTLTNMAVYSSDLYGSLAPYVAYRNMYNPVGGIELAITQERWEDMVRLHGEAMSYGVEAYLLSAQEVTDKVPLVDPNQCVGGVFIPKSAIISGALVSAALARDTAAMAGEMDGEMGRASFVGHTTVTDIEVINGHVTAVLTDNPEMPRIECETVLLCANIWAPAISEKIGVSLPLMAFEHQYTITTPLDELADFDVNNKDDEITIPTMRELDSAMYYRQHWDKWGVGSYDHAPHMVHPRNVGKTAMHPFTPEDFAGPWRQATNLIPALKGKELTHSFNGMFAFSVDGYPIIGETQIKGVWSAVASWITHAGGVGKSVAEWMTNGDTEWDMRQCTIDRFADFQTTQRYIDVVCTKNYREVYDLVHPRQSISEPRNIRLSPFHARHEALGATFTAFAGLELPNWFESNTRLLEKYNDQIPERDGWYALEWSRIQGAEHLETRENVALFDLTGLSIIEIRGAGAVKFVNYLCSNQMDKPVGQVIYTTWLTPAGGVKRDLAVARVADDCYWMFVGEGTLPQDLAWVNQHIPKDSNVYVSDISNSYTAVGLWGPNARKVLSKTTTADVSNDAFPYFACQWIDVGMTRVLALRLSYAGELGWELHIPTDAALSVWDTLWAAGREFDMVATGMGAFDSLRIEKGYRLWGGDVYTEYNAYESGLNWTVRIKKGDFIGRDACVAIRRQMKEQGLKKKLCCLTSTAPNARALGYEPIYHTENGHSDCIGHVTTANYGYSAQTLIAYGYLPTQYAAVGTELEIMYQGERFPVLVSDEPLVDAEMVKLRS